MLFISAATFASTYKFHKVKLTLDNETETCFINGTITISDNFVIIKTHGNTTVYKTYSCDRKGQGGDARLVMKAIDDEDIPCLISLCRIGKEFIFMITYEGGHIVYYLET